ncbi:hypothetical protein IEO21_07912 [Rhodonia placenta]|uniref:F-box domain-containing protein n=1 Tax=Rhodonia placenta TaxID=104341 RepID=A0A8H7NXM2_9APHY|nr:hypothetical protein IEO21_07912 [Postia placenta]
MIYTYWKTVGSWISAATPPAASERRVQYQQVDRTTSRAMTAASPPLLSPVQTSPIPSPISRIPDDLLHEIFHLVAAEAFFTSDRPSRLGSIACVAISHVCRYWRELALASPLLWSYIQLTPTLSRYSTVRELLGRSGDAPLLVRMQGPRSVWESAEGLVQMARILAVHSHRFVEFYATSFLPEPMRDVISQFSCPAPHLKSLSIHPGSFVWLPAPFLGWMPMVKHVSATQMAMPWLPYKDMVELELSDQRAPLLEDLLWTLRHSPSLKVLSVFLSGALVPRSAVEVDETSVVILPNLQRLSLGSLHSISDTLTLLSHIAFTVTTEVNLRFHGRYRSPLDLGQFCPSLQHIAHRVTQCFVQFLNTHQSRSAVLKSDDGHMALEWQWREDEDDDGRLDSVALAAIPFPAIKSLILQVYNFDARREEWYGILCRLSEVTYLELDFRLVNAATIVAFFHSLSRCPNDEETVCPKLEHLVILRAGSASNPVWMALKVALSLRVSLEAPRLKMLEVMVEEKHFSDVEDTLSSCSIRTNSRTPLSQEG